MSSNQTNPDREVTMSNSLTIDEWTERMMGGYTEAQLEAAFALVSNPENWKLPINMRVTAECPPSQIARAVTFYTGSVAEITSHADGSHTVVAAGYYATLG